MRRMARYIRECDSLIAALQLHGRNGIGALASSSGGMMAKDQG